MIVVTHAYETDSNSDLLNQIYMLRARQFKDRRKWRVEVINGKERDKFDDMNPLYVCVVGPHRKLLACLRLLPTIGPHMLSDVFPEVMAGAGIVRNPLVIESSRFCVDTHESNRAMQGGVNVVTRELLTGLFQTAKDAGMSHVISVYDVFMERILHRAGCPFERLGPIIEYDGLKTVAGKCEVSTEVIEAISWCQNSSDQAAA